MEWEKQDGREEAGDHLPSNGGQRPKGLKRRLRRSSQNPRCGKAAPREESQKGSNRWGGGVHTSP